MGYENFMAVHFVGVYVNSVAETVKPRPHRQMIRSGVPDGCFDLGTRS